MDDSAQNNSLNNNQTTPGVTAVQDPPAAPIQASSDQVPEKKDEELGSDNKLNIESSSSNPKPTNSQIQKLDDKIKAANLPQELHDKVVAMVDRLRLIGNDSSFFIELDSTSRYIDWATTFPWGNSSKDILDLAHAQQVLNKNHYGLNEVKEKILEYLSIMILKEQKSGGAKEVLARAPIISLVGLAGVGKTTIAFSIAEALGRKIERIPFGGMGSASQLRGKSRLFPDAEPGLIIKALKRAGTNNPVLLLDEIDRVSEEQRADIMGVLVELLDPQQNKAFTDHFLDYPVDLSNVLFVATSNNTKDISTAVIDRLEIIQMPSYNDEEKTVIGKTFVLPVVLQESGLTEKDLVVNDDVWEEFIIRPIGYDPGIRSLQRIIQGIARKVVFNMLQGKLPKDQQFVLSQQNVKEYVSQW